MTQFVTTIIHELIHSYGAVHSNNDLFGTDTIESDVEASAQQLTTMLLQALEEAGIDLTAGLPYICGGH